MNYIEKVEEIFGWDYVKTFEKTSPEHYKQVKEMIEQVTTLLQESNEEAVRYGMALELENIDEFINEGTNFEELKFYLLGRYNAMKTALDKEPIPNGTAKPNDTTDNTSFLESVVNEELIKGVQKNIDEKLATEHDKKIAEEAYERGVSAYIGTAEEYKKKWQEDATKKERDRWLNQTANEHDKKIAEEAVRGFCKYDWEQNNTVNNYMAWEYNPDVDRKRIEEYLSSRGDKGEI